MKLAIPYEEGQIFQHFGKTPAFKIYDIANGQVGGSMVFPTGGQGHGALAGLLRALGIGAVVCGGLGPGAIDALSQLNILPLPGVTGSADQAAQNFAAGKLVADPDALCHHHDGVHTCSHHGEGHGCGGSCH